MPSTPVESLQGNNDFVLGGGKLAWTGVKGYCAQKKSHTVHTRKKNKKQKTLLRENGRQKKKIPETGRTHVTQHFLAHSGNQGSQKGGGKTRELPLET